MADRSRHGIVVFGEDSITRQARNEHKSAKDSVAHVRAIRKKSKEVSAKTFLDEIKKWQKSKACVLIYLP